MVSDESTLVQSRSSLFVLQGSTLTLYQGVPQPSTAHFAFNIGDSIDQKYDILAMLGEGGMGAVYKAHHRLLDKTVALKTFKTVHTDQETLMRFQREARALAKLNHPNIVQIFDYGLTGQNVPYYTMEYLEGESLADLLKRKGRLSISETLGIFYQVCHGLSAAHLKDILHRDLKPSNIFLVPAAKNASKADRYKASLVDFGLATNTSGQADEQGKTLAGVICGSPLYMSPEQGRGEALSPASDIYSLGCTLYECLTGTAPFVGVNSLHTLMLRDNEVAPTLAQNGGGKEFPPELEKIVATMLRHEPAERQPNIELVLDDLDYLLTSRKKAAALAAAEESAPQDNHEPGGKPTRVALMVSGVVVILIGALAVFAYNHFHLAAHQNAKAATVAPRPLDLPSPGLVCDTVQVGKERFSRVVWPGHLIGRITDGDDIKNQRNELRWPEDSFRSVSFSTDFCADSNNFKALHNIVLHGLTLEYPFDRPRLKRVLLELTKQKGLRHIILDKQPAEDEDLQTLAKVKELEDFAAIECQITGGALGKFALGKKLSGLGFDTGRDVSALLKQLAHYKNIFWLSVNDAPLSKADLQNIATLTQLHTLKLANTGLDDTNLKILSPLDHAFNLDLQQNNLTPACVGILKGFESKVRANIESYGYHAKVSANATWTERDRDIFNRAFPLSPVDPKLPFHSVKVDSESEQFFRGIEKN